MGIPHQLRSIRPARHDAHQTRQDRTRGPQTAVGESKAIAGDWSGYRGLQAALLRYWMTTADLSDAIELLRAFGFGPLVDELLDPSNYTRKTARLNHTAVCRKLGWSAHQLRTALEKCRELLADLADD